MCLARPPSAHLRRRRVRTAEGTYIQASDEHLEKVLRLSGTGSAKAVATPQTAGREEPKDNSPHLEREEVSLYRACAMGWLYYVSAREDVHREAGMPTSC